jgi:hypothetical protein
VPFGGSCALAGCASRSEFFCLYRRWAPLCRALIFCAYLVRSEANHRQLHFSVENVVHRGGAEGSGQLWRCRTRSRSAKFLVGLTRPRCVSKSALRFSSAAQCCAFVYLEALCGVIRLWSCCKCSALFALWTRLMEWQRVPGSSLHILSACIVAGGLAWTLDNVARRGRSRFWLDDYLWERDCSFLCGACLAGAMLVTYPLAMSLLSLRTAV